MPLPSPLTTLIQQPNHPPPPIQTWHPTTTLDIDLRIDTNARWHHRGTIIHRTRIIKLFASLLRLEPDNKHYLITPKIKYPITVTDAPFHAIELTTYGTGKNQHLIFRTNVDDIIHADHNHHLCIPLTATNTYPHIQVRPGLQAKLTRPVYYELANLLHPAPQKPTNTTTTYGVYSHRIFFPFGELK